DGSRDPAAGAVPPHVLPPARPPRRLAWHGAVRARRRERVSQVRAFVGALPMTSLLLVQDFPPMGGGIARLHGELVKHYPSGEVIVSTPQNRDASDFDAQFNGTVEWLSIILRSMYMVSVIFMLSILV